MTDATREAIDTAIWSEDWQRAQTLLLLAIADQLAAIGEYLTAQPVWSPPVINVNTPQP